MAKNDDDGVLSLQPLYEYLERKEFIDEALHGKGKLGKEFGKICREICANGCVPEIGGVYLWGFYDSQKFWNSIYLGKAGRNETAGLGRRISEELLTERSCFWRPKKTELELWKWMQTEGKIHYPKKWADYLWDWERAFKKAGTTHIVWVATQILDEAQIGQLERSLIELMNPSANRDRITPDGSLDTKEIMEVAGRIRILINENRDKIFPLSLA